MSSKIGKILRAFWIVNLITAKVLKLIRCWSRLRICSRLIFTTDRFPVIIELYLYFFSFNKKKHFKIYFKLIVYIWRIVNKVLTLSTWFIKKNYNNFLLLLLLKTQHNYIINLKVDQQDRQTYKFELVPKNNKDAGVMSAEEVKLMFAKKGYLNNL